jgi:hypothetical protein
VGRHDFVLRKEVLPFACDRVMCLTLSFLDDLEVQDAGSKASIKEIFGILSGRLSASTPAEATAVLRRPMIRMQIKMLFSDVSRRLRSQRDVLSNNRFERGSTVSDLHFAYMSEV